MISASGIGSEERLAWISSMKINDFSVTYRFRSGLLAVLHAVLRAVSPVVLRAPLRAVLRAALIHPPSLTFVNCIYCGHDTSPFAYFG